MSHSLRVRALCGDPFMPKSIVGHWLLVCRQLRSHRAWIKEGCYAWWRHTDDLKTMQRKLAVFRSQRRTIQGEDR